MKCENCQIVFTDNTDTIDTDAIYSIEYYEGGQHDGYLSYLRTEHILKKEFKQTLEKITNLIKANKNKKLLEIGCAYGYFLDLAKEYYNVSGIEISNYAADLCKKRGLNVSHSSIDNYFSTSKDYYDIIVMLDVIEHLADPIKDLSTIKNHLNRDGIVIITTGDISSFFSKITKSHWRLMTPPQHLFFFSKNVLTKILQQAGFEILSVSYPWKFVPISLILFQLKRILNINLTINTNHGFYVNLFDAMLITARKK